MQSLLLLCSFSGTEKVIQRLIYGLAFLFFITQPAHLQATTQAILSEEMVKYLQCFPLELMTLKKHRPTIDTEDLCLANIYHETGAQPLWVTADGPSMKASIILYYLRNSERHGLDPKEYAVDKILELWPIREAADLAKLDTLLTYNLVKYVHDISYGQLKPLKSDPKLFAEAGDMEFNPVRTIEHLITTDDLDRFLTSLPPRHQHYVSLQNGLEQYRQIDAVGGWPNIERGKTLHPRDSDLRIIFIRQRLQLTDQLTQIQPPYNTAYYDDDMQEAVLRFQKRHGLEEDGIIGAKTLAAMNVTVSERIDSIRINLARWRWQAHNLGEKYLLVNIAGYNLKGFEKDDLSLDLRVIVGKQQHQTPVFSDRIKYLDFNPFWNITPSIAKNEELPELQKNPYYLVERNVRLFSSWQADAEELDSTTMDWHTISPGRMAGFKLRQDPGPWNALGKVKFVFPNTYSVYMHDTPAHDLFSHSQRNFSHGCIRVSDPLALAIFTLDGQKGDWSPEKVTDIYNQTARKVVRLSAPIPVHITYQTTWVDKDGTIHFNRDIYGRDTKLFKALLN